MVISILINQRIITTMTKAKSARRLVDKVITLGKKNTLSAKRRAFSIICDHRLVKKLFDEIAPLFANRQGGYTRIIPYKNQRGDNAQMVLFELTETLKVKKPEKKEKQEKKSESAEVKKQVIDVDKKKDKDIEPVSVIESEVAAKEKEAPKKETPKQHIVEKEDKKEQEKKPKKLFGGFKNLFRKDKDLK
jgi:large subunit ribosomal protein L17